MDKDEKKKPISETTAKYKKRYWIFTALSWALTLGPLAGYTVYGFCAGGTLQKAALISSVFAALVLTALSVVFKKHVRSTIFILLLGVYIALNKITVLLVILSICTILDEFLVTPLQKKYHSKYTINKEIDSRIEKNG